MGLTIHKKYNSRYRQFGSRQVSLTTATRGRRVPEKQDKQNEQWPRHRRRSELEPTDPELLLASLKLHERRSALTSTLLSSTSLHQLHCGEHRLPIGTNSFSGDKRVNGLGNSYTIDLSST